MNQNYHEIYDIVVRKRNGLDCTETESAEVMQWMKENWATLPEGMKELFPLEYGDVCEQENEQRAEEC